MRTEDVIVLALTARYPAVGAPLQQTRQMAWVGRELVRDALRELADPVERKRLWLSSGAPEVSSFEECVCRLFDDSGLAIALDKGEAVFGPEADDQLRKVGQLVRRVEPHRPPAQILDDPLVVEAGEQAAVILSIIGL